MFTGLIRELAKVDSFDGRYLKLKAKHKPNIGDSVAINGACLTVIEVNSDSFVVEISDESKNILYLDRYKDLVHIEPAMQLSDRFEGHIVQGHIDTLGDVTNIIKNNNSFDFTIKIDKKYMKFVVKKGSIAIDGVSLTINEIFDDSFRLTIITHTFDNTLFNDYKIGQKVQIEFDFFAKYIYNLFKKDISWADIDKIQFLY